MKTKPVLRAATAADFEAYTRLSAQVLRLHVDALPKIFHATPFPGGHKEQFLERLRDPDRALFVADLAGDLVGYVKLRVQNAPSWPIFVPKRSALVSEIGVDAAHQRKGIGMALMAKARIWGREQGCAELKLDVKAFNTQAAAFYRRLGFVTTTETLASSLLPET